MQLKNPSGQTLDPLNYLDSSDLLAELNDGGIILHCSSCMHISSLYRPILKGLMYWMLDIMLFIMEWGVVHIGGGCSFERNYGETFHRNCYYRGKGIGFPFYQY